MQPPVEIEGYEHSSEDGSDTTKQRYDPDRLYG